MHRSTALPGVILLATVLLAQGARAQFDEWRHHGVLALLTTPDGANLPAAAREENFPVLVRLEREGFDFSEARPDGADLRFSWEGRPLPFEIERWDAARGEACVWVRVPVITGATRQELGIHWGRPDAAPASDGRSVFNASNGHAVVMHLADPSADTTGTLTPADRGTAGCEGVIGAARRFLPGKGIVGGEKVPGLPAGAGPCTTEAWIRTSAPHGTLVGWGNEQLHGKVVLALRSPPHLRVDGYFSGANVEGVLRIPAGEWVHVVHAYHQGGSSLYVNGRLDTVYAGRDAALNVRSPAGLWIGGWHHDFRYTGDMDEVRISTAERSADWIKLSYENQKPNQTLVGRLARPGSALGVSHPKVVLDEGQTLTVTAQADGAEKIYWIRRRGDEETVLSADRLHCTVEAGRVTEEASWTLRFKAVFPSATKVIDIPVSIRNTIPEPAFSLTAPSRWNGRDPVEIVPRLKNLNAMQAAGAGAWRARWVVQGGAVTQDPREDRLILRRAQFSGPLQVSARLSNGGAEVHETVTLQVTEPARDAWADRVPEPDEKPEQGQFFARDERDQGTLHYRGTLDRPAESVFLRVFSGDEPYRSETLALPADRSFAFAVKLKPGLVHYRVEFGARTGGKEEILDRVGDLVCGDAYLIDGQSNALATDTHEDSPRVTHEWIRSYGGPTGREDGDRWLRQRLRKQGAAGRLNLWCRPVWKADGTEAPAELGWWAMELAKHLVESNGVPVCFLQCAVGGSRIDEHLPAAPDRADLRTLYGRMLWRLRQARLTHGIRAVIWHQGENDQGADGPTGLYGWETYQEFFLRMSAAWKEDMPNLGHYYVFQIWPDSCAMSGRSESGDRLREAQRTLPRLFSNMSILSTLGIRPPGGCHFPLEGWSEFARMLQPLIDRDFHGRVPTGPITPPDLQSASYNEKRDEITLRFDQPVRWSDALAREFYLDNQAGEVVSGRSTDSAETVVLKLKSWSTARRITYLKERSWSQDRLLLGTNGIAALSFYDVRIMPLPAR